MAVQEYEPRFDSPYAEEEITPLEHFHASLHGMVMEVEADGSSAFGHLKAVQADLRQKQIQLMKEFMSGGHSTEELASIQEEMIIIYHSQVWTEGYIRDRQPK